MSVDYPTSWCPRSSLTLALAVLSIAALVEAAPSAAAQEPRSTAERSDTLGRAPLPWDDLSVAAQEELTVLDRRIDLARRGVPGEEKTYVIRRVNVNLDRTGQPLSRVVVEGTVRATLLREVDRDRWEKRFVWERYAMGQSAGEAGPLTLRDVPEARGIDYTVRPAGLDAVDPAGDFGRLGEGLEAVMMKVLAIDVHAWDSLVRGLRADVGDTVVIGATGRLADAPEAVDLIGPDGSESMGNFRFGESRLAVAGLTRWGGEPCVMIWFSMEGNRVTQNLDGPPVSLEMEGTEYFSGILTLSLRDGRFLAGRLWGLVPSRISVGLPGQELAEQPIYAVHQEVEMHEVAARRE